MMQFFFLDGINIHTQFYGARTEFLRVNCKLSGGSVTVKVSKSSSSKFFPSSPGAKLTSKFCAIIESEVRRLS
jgi:hypothetical protein